jgi:NADH:ubiquinone oxidoreductase subunit E
VTAEEAATLDRILEEHRPRPGRPANILRTLLAVDQVFARVPPEAVARIARMLDVPEADVMGVLSYYPDLHTKRRGRHIVRLCLGEACVANRSTGLLAELKHELHIGLGETTADGRFTLERVYCLGNCGVGPTVMVDDQLYGRVTGMELRRILKQGGERESGSV